MTARVQIVLARCERRGGAFGVRFEERDPAHWQADWAFPMSVEAGMREGYDKTLAGGLGGGEPPSSTTIEGQFHFAAAYPGCPWCESRGLFLCGCGHAACWDTRAESAACPWCGDTSKIEGTIDRLTAGGDR